MPYGTCVLMCTGIWAAEGALPLLEIVARRARARLADCDGVCRLAQHLHRPGGQVARSCSSSATHILPRRAPSWHCASRTRGGPRHRAGHTRHPGMVAPQPGPALPLGFLRPERHTAVGEAVQDGLAHHEGETVAPCEDVHQVPSFWRPCARAACCVIERAGDAWRRHAHGRWG